MSEICPASQLSPVFHSKIFLVVAKAYWKNSYRIVAFDGQQLFDINVSNMNSINPGNAYQFQLVTAWDSTIVAAQPLCVQGAPILVEILLNDMFAALANIAGISFGNLYPNVGNETYLNVGTFFQTPRAFLVQGNMIKKQKMINGKTRCSILTDVGEKDLRYTGFGLDSYSGLPEVYDSNLGWRKFTLILVVADPIIGPWIGQRCYILVVAVYLN